ncbi:MAG: cytochrome c maturation protein CcmE [Pseudomonadota bacterium]|jgi:cytochrome c-type biogenesis protein CcmE
MKPRHRRLALVAAGLLLASAGVTLALGAFRSNLVFFVTPAQIAAGQAERGALLRVGGLVQPGSIARDAAEGLKVRFVLADGPHTLPVVFEGVLPDLFSAGRGAIAQGRIDASGTLVATEVLAKHDENYTPPGVK